MTTNTHAGGETFEPRRGNISDAELRYYLRRARNLRAQAFHDVARGLARGVGHLWAMAVRRATDRLRHNSLWRAPGTGNCLNC